MQLRLIIVFIFFISKGYSQFVEILDKTQKTPVSFATISFGNGNGIFADSQGTFYFSKKLYTDIDSLYISSIGFKELKIATKNLPKQLFLTPDIATLKEVYLTNKKQGKYHTETIAPKTHDDYFKCWLPTVESEIAVFFPSSPDYDSKISTVSIPIKKEDSHHSRGKTQRFSTLFKMQFYHNDNGKPGQRLLHDHIIFKITDKDKKVYELSIDDKEIFIPKDGIFISIQVLGYTDKKGELQKSPKYHVVKTNRGIVKVSTTFRPLLPFTQKFKEDRTFVRRIFYKNRAWQKFDATYNDTNNLVLSKFNNYGLGIKLHHYKKID